MSEVPLYVYPACSMKEKCFKFHAPARQEFTFRVQGSGFRVQGSEFRVWGLGSKSVPTLSSREAASNPPKHTHLHHSDSTAPPLQTRQSRNYQSHSTHERADGCSAAPGLEDDTAGGGQSGLVGSMRC